MKINSHHLLLWCSQYIDFIIIKYAFQSPNKIKKQFGQYSKQD